MATSDSTTKRCSKCGIEYPATLEYFLAEKHGRFGLRGDCIICSRARSKRYRETHPEIQHAASLRWYYEHHDYALLKQQQWRENNRDKARAASRNYYANNAPKACAATKRWKENNLEKHREGEKRYRLLNPDKVRAKSQKRRAKKRTLPHTFTEQDWERALNHFHGCCAYCGNPPSMFDRDPILHQEHFKPLSQNGGYIPDNIVPACQSCNLSKIDKDPYEWILSRFGKRNGKTVIKRILDYFATI